MFADGVVRGPSRAGIKREMLTEQVLSVATTTIFVTEQAEWKRFLKNQVATNQDSTRHAYSGSPRPGPKLFVCGRTRMYGSISGMNIIIFALAMSRVPETTTARKQPRHKLFTAVGSHQRIVGPTKVRQCFPNVDLREPKKCIPIHFVKCLGDTTNLM